MADIPQPFICGFVPPYILQAIASSDSYPEESRLACLHTLKHAKSYADERDDSCAYDHEVLAQAQQAAQQEAQQAAQQTLAAAGGEPAAGGESAARMQIRIYDCKETANRPGTLARSEGQARVKDRQVNNCYDGFRITHDFFSEVFKRNSLDHKGLPLIASVHYKPATAPNGYNNAFWDGMMNQMVFGDGDHIFFDYFTDSLDVIAHELSHGFVQYSSPLIYYGESGALNESCADIFGCMVEQWHMRQTAAEADWNLGQTMFPVAFTGSALRTLKAGRAFVNDPVFRTDPQPKHMDKKYKGKGDRGGVHINSGIPNHAFYKAATRLEGSSWDKVGRVWYKTMTSGEILPDCNFHRFAEVTVKIAKTEFNQDQSVWEAIHAAWGEVGIRVPTESTGAGESAKGEELKVNV
ncbi:hypothetical protein W97_03757 [Coniosporium apollinis CBS 100218]|uniref:Peptidase M4 C-terminal domain-containing protein n=1 Tax=Coniosporium apollinis (strain CBS 100218) TaxID=1168221 RepID=R7YRS4_CONA1|nr:uncharacterized protein W97_03757 [Coniosporium apollinis CBS 100218]EON64524.1 hypothetical protein W97_03757 [Coniosporium apollinis CBS 100218]